MVISERRQPIIMKEKENEFFLEEEMEVVCRLKRRKISIRSNVHVGYLEEERSLHLYSLHYVETETTFLRVFFLRGRGVLYSGSSIEIRTFLVCL